MWINTRGSDNKKGHATLMNYNSPALETLF